ncbi:ArsR family transcriptional regulator [Desulfovibrio sp. DS-1]|nr:metalloregulator ArsR/SmtB family transcription factor [Nitratidesulfovibrio sp. SRB-5]RXF76307.1 ArsR family transcriptional regulator [Desulfovibrio sp. DS-1]
METKHAVTLFEALSSGTRLELFRLLVRHAPEGLVAGDIARLLGISASNLSFHLKALVHAGLITMEKEGKFLRYRAEIPLMLNLIAYLTSECCSGNPEQCQNFRKASKVVPQVLPQMLPEDA